ncbi:DUF1837 domain-containing protein [Cellulomonas sp. ACRRI]|uniref:HamA C-terminal domain-containing protein n=1 Tax=Cellulomonas sp. ACRRI TaxID=2918188 RepID=UPI001EF29B66|nr:DUF1837 domain-containing protein [Cellulomonas sp. ACRRI]MCG7286384.1 DUF1837 domain-containing protein [Cellulomonas sp. ACRRI]
MADATTTPLPLSLVNRRGFLDLFYEPVSTNVHVKTAVHLHVLRVDGGNFALPDLYRELSNAALGYVLSRRNLQQLRVGDMSRTVEVVNKVQSQFRRPDPNAGEGGEVLLYALLEGHLGAPKVLSKMELKTAPNHYVNGADGVHLLSDADGTFQLIFGESKLYGDLKGEPRSSAPRAIRAAFKSIANVHENGFRFDTWLVESQLLKEVLDPEHLVMLERILLPAAAGESAVSKTNAFGILIGFEIDAQSIAFEDLTTPQIEEALRDAAGQMVQENIGLISSEIKDRALGGYPFHIYAVPFLKTTVRGVQRGVESVRVDMVNALRNDTGGEE